MIVVCRNSNETQIRLSIREGSGIATVSTGEPFLDHMLVTLARYAGVDLEVQAVGRIRYEALVTAMDRVREIASSALALRKSTGSRQS